MSTTPDLSMCVICCREAVMVCPQCDQTLYCGGTHLSQDRARHERDCPGSTNTALQIPRRIATPPPVGTEYCDVFALILMPNEDHVRVNIMRCRLGDNVHDPTQWTPLVSDWFTVCNPVAIVLDTGLNDQPLRFPLQLWYCPASMEKGDPPNHAIRRITCGLPCQPWYGPVVVLKFSGTRKRSYIDAGSNDLPTLSNFFFRRA